MAIFIFYEKHQRGSVGLLLPGKVKLDEDDEVGEKSVIKERALEEEEAGGPTKRNQERDRRRRRRRRGNNPLVQKGTKTTTTHKLLFLFLSSSFSFLLFFGVYLKYIIGVTEPAVVVAQHRQPPVTTKN